MGNNKYKALKPAVLAFLAEGGGQREAARIFGMTDTTVFRWAHQSPDHDAVVKANRKRQGDRMKLLDPMQMAELLRRDATGKYTRSQLALEYGISRETLYKYLRAARKDLGS